jgi:hypothetical protein
MADLADRFVLLTRPDGKKFPVAPAWVYYIRPPFKNEQGNAVLVFGGGMNQQVMETVAVARDILEGRVETKWA